MVSDHETQVWVRLWDNIIPEDEWESVEDKYLYMYMDKDLPIRFRVIDEKFTDVGTKGPPPKRTGAVAGQKAPMPAPSSLPSDVMINPIMTSTEATTTTPSSHEQSARRMISSAGVGGSSSGIGGVTSGLKTGSSTISGNKLIIPFSNTKQVPYELIGSIAERGLGATVWNWS